MIPTTAYTNGVSKAARNNLNIYWPMRSGIATSRDIPWKTMKATDMNITVSINWLVVVDTILRRHKSSPSENSRSL
jgi:hypothetical protein